MISFLCQNNVHVDFFDVFEKKSLTKAQDAIIINANNRKQTGE